MADLTKVERDQLAAKLNQDPAAAMEAATKAVHRILSQDNLDITLTVHDKFWKPIQECHDHISVTAAKPRNGVPTLEIQLKGSDPLVPVFRKCRKEVVGITLETAGLRWAFTIDSTSYKLQDGLRTLTAKCVGVYDILNYVLVWPNFLLPIQTQVPSRAWFIGPICTVIESLIAEQAFRLQSGLWDLVNNLGSLNLDWRTWFGTWLMSNGNLWDMLHTPIYVVHHNPFFDTSPWVSGTFRMDTAAAAIDKLIAGYGVSVDVELWKPGDPQPDAWGNLNIPTYVVRVTDRSSVTGPTGTFLDGIVTQVVNLQGSVLGDVLAPFLNPRNQPHPEFVNIAPLLGVNFIQPWTLLIDHPRGPMEEFEITDHHPLGHTQVIGGKSPKWLNDLINATLAWLIDCLMIVIGLTGVPSNILDGIFNDAFLAFQLVQNFSRRNEMGPYGRPERMIATGAAPYNVDALFTFIREMYNSRGYRSATATIRNGLPYAIGRDIFVGGLISIAWDDELYTDYVEMVVITDNRKERAKVTIQVGDGKREEHPIVRSLALITGLQEVINTVTLSPSN